jgi:hypothetical protein
MLLKDAQKENAHTSLMDFIAVCYLDGDLVDRDESEGLRWLLQAATEGISDRFRLIQARERVLMEYTRAGKELNLPLAERTDWILDSIFLLRGGYWHTLGYPEYASKLQGVRDSFKRALAYLSYENIPNILDIGLNIYVLRNPTDADERRQREANAARMGLVAPSTFAVRKVVLSANNTQANSLVAGGIDVTEFWDVDLVRAVAHYGYEDSIRLLHRLDVTRQHVLLGSNTESPQSALVRAINNRQVSFDGLSRESSEFGPAIHEAVLNHRFSCLSEILRQSWTTEHEEDRVQLNNSYVVEDIYGLETPLDVSIRMLQPYLVCLLLAHGADCNNVNEVTGETALHICCRMDVRTDDSMVHWCDRLSYLSAVTEERKSEDMVATHRVVFELLLDRPGIKLDVPNIAGETPMQLCIEAGNIEFVERLVECGAEHDGELLEILQALSMGSQTGDA